MCLSNGIITKRTMRKPPWMASVEPSKIWSTIKCCLELLSSRQKFAKFANEISNVDCLFLSKEHLLKESEEVEKSTPIPTTLKIHKVKRVKEGNSLVNEFCYLSEDMDSFYNWKYGVQCGHKVSCISNNNICNWWICHGWRMGSIPYQNLLVPWKVHL